MRIRTKAVICFAVISALIVPWPIFAGVCAQQVVKQRVVSYAYAQPVVTYQQAYISPYQYAIGSDLILESLAEKLAARIEQKLVERQRAEQPRSVVVESCARCHVAGSKAVVELEAPVFFDAHGNLTANAEQRASMKTAARLGAMPPPPAKPLDDDTFLELRRELERHVEPQRAPPPPPSPEALPPE